MAVSRRQFLTHALSAAALGPVVPSWATPRQNPSTANPAQQAGPQSHFGNWLEDEFGLPAFHYTCDQIRDPKAITEVNPGVLAPAEHIHQVGNDRLVAVASNFGHVRVR